MHSSMDVDFNIRCEVFIYFNNAAADVAIKRVVGAKHSYAMQLDFVLYQVQRLVHFIPSALASSKRATAQSLLESTISGTYVNVG
ncbi:MAG: hypothetical protein ACI82I_000953 [Gammaproteobacteria bacterium]|jgi:hypothetical protein